MQFDLELSRMLFILGSLQIKKKTLCFSCDGQGVLLPGWPDIKAVQNTKAKEEVTKLKAGFAASFLVLPYTLFVTQVSIKSIVRRSPLITLFIYKCQRTC